MTSRQWLLEQEPRWQRLEQLLNQSQHGFSALPPQEIRELGLLYREVMHALSRTQSLPEFQYLEPYLNNLAQRCHGRIYVRPPVSWRDVLRFFMVDFPRCFRKHWLLIALAFGMFVGGTGLALATVHFNPATETYFLPPAVISQLDQGLLWTDGMQADPSQSSFLMTNNIRVAINAFAFGMVFGVGTLVLLFTNGLFAFGGPLGVCIRHGMGGRLLTFVMAHGVIELTTIFIAGGAGMVMGFALLFPGQVSRWRALRNSSKDALVLIMGCFPLLVIAGLVEGLISLNRNVGVEVRLVVSVLSLFFLIAYLGWAGRSRPGRLQPEDKQPARCTI